MTLRNLHYTSVLVPWNLSPVAFCLGITSRTLQGISLWSWDWWSLCSCCLAMHRLVWRESPHPLDWKASDSQVTLRFQEQIPGALCWPWTDGAFLYLAVVCVCESDWTSDYGEFVQFFPYLPFGSCFDLTRKYNKKVSVSGIYLLPWLWIGGGKHDRIMKHLYCVQRGCSTEKPLHHSTQSNQNKQTHSPALVSPSLSPWACKSPRSGWWFYRGTFLYHEWKDMRKEKGKSSRLWNKQHDKKMNCCSCWYTVWEN